MIQKIHLLAIWTLGIFVLLLLFVHPSVVPDTLFGIKIGEVVLRTRTVPTHELFSWSAMGRNIIPYEWLIQTVFAAVHRIGGFPAIDYLVAVSQILFIGIGYFLFFRVFGKHPFASLLLSLILGYLISDFFVARPQIIGYILFFFYISLILLFILKKDNRLFLTFPLTFIWVNAHASFIFIPYFFASYTSMGFLYWKKDPVRAKHVGKTLALYGVINTLITLFPPLWHKPYELLLQFFLNMKFITAFITEWYTSGTKPQLQAVYTVCLFITILISLIVSFKTKQFKKWFLAAPLLVITVLSYQAVRHIPTGFITSFVILGLFLHAPHIRIQYRNVLGTFFFLVAVSVLAFLFWQKKSNYAPFNPGISEHDRMFLKKNHLEGNMFNEYTWGGNLLYYLYPDYRVFLDARTDVYLCCELRDFWNVLNAKFASHETFTKAMHTFLDTYPFSYLLVVVPSVNPMEYTTASLMADTLMDDLNWKLIYFSDTIIIILKHDGKNRALLDSMGMTSVTPYRLTPYRANQEQQARQEYLRMIAVTDSAVARVGLGQTYLAAGKPNDARVHFIRASTLNPQYGPAYIGLAKVAIQNGEPQKAETYLTNALTVAPYLGESYVLLGQLYKDADENDLAISVLHEGLKQHIDFLSRQKIVQLLNRIP